MDWLWPWLKLFHVVGIAMAVGAATVRALLLGRATRDAAMAAAYVAARRSLVLIVVVGVHLLQLSGVGWLLLGYPLSALLVFKIVVVFVIGGLGAYTARRIEPRFLEVASAPGSEGSAELVRAGRGLLLAEASTAGLYYAVIAVWVLQT